MRAQTQKLLIFFLTVFALGGYFGYDFGRKGYALDFKKNPPSINVINRNSPAKNLDFSLFWQVFELLNQKSIYRPLDPQKALYGAIKGLTDSLEDPYTAFLPPSQNESVNSSLTGKYEGIGAELGIKDKQLMIVAPLDDSPAKGAGVRSGDAILKIDDRDTSGISLTEAVSLIRGKAGTTISLMLQRVNIGEPFTIAIKRAKITVQSVKWEERDGGLAYIRISRFGESTNEEWDKAVTEILDKMGAPKGLVLDLRSNPGGYLESSIHIASEFVRAGPVVFEEFADGRREPFNVTRTGKLLTVPVVVLINKGSASASEILAGALRDVRSSTLVGEKSFGKGTVQDARNFPDGSGVHITMAKWLTPKGVSINGHGIDVDVKIEFKEDAENPEYDPQLEKAFEVLRGK